MFVGSDTSSDGHPDMCVRVIERVGGGKDGGDSRFTFPACCSLLQLVAACCSVWQSECVAVVLPADSHSHASVGTNSQSKCVCMRVHVCMCKCECAAVALQGWGYGTPG